MKVKIEHVEDVTTEPRPSRSTAEIKQLALDVHAGKVFGSWNVTNQQDVGMVFMPMVLIDSLAVKMLERDDVVHVFEYLDKAGPRSINGMPCFFSMGTLNREEFGRMVTAVKKIEDMSKAFMEDEDDGAV